jgi:hypothetical protein
LWSDARPSVLVSMLVPTRIHIMPFSSLAQPTMRACIHYSILCCLPSLVTTATMQCTGGDVIVTMPHPHPAVGASHGQCQNHVPRKFVHGTAPDILMLASDGGDSIDTGYWMSFEAPPCAALNCTRPPVTQPRSSIEAANHAELAVWPLRGCISAFKYALIRHSHGGAALLAKAQGGPSW